jgi:flagellar motor switch protein FliN/FliY
MSEAPRLDSKSKVHENFDLLSGVSVRLSIEVGSTKMTLAELSELDAGSVVALARQVGEPLDVCANGSCIARGEIVSVEGRYGIRVTELIATQSGVGNVERRR